MYHSVALQGSVILIRINPRAALDPADRDLTLPQGWYLTAFQAKDTNFSAK